MTNPEGIDETVYGFSERFVPSDWKPLYNLNPREDIPVVYVDDSGRRALRPMHWNFVPGHLASRDQVMAFDAQYSTFNAKVERAATAPTFRSAWRKQRCLVVVDGIFEWVGAKGAKIPHLIRRRDSATFAMAGLWSVWRGSDGEELWSCAIVVGPSTDWYTPFHHRMAVMLPPQRYDAWLDSSLTDARAVEETLKASSFPQSEALEAVVVSRKVNNPRYDSPDCLLPDAAA